MLFQSGKVICRPFAVVEFDLLRREPEPPHTEDWVIDPAHVKFLNLLPQERRKSLLGRLDDGGVENIFEATIHREPGCYVMAGEGSRSLGTVKAREILNIPYYPKKGGSWDYRIEFVDALGGKYRLAVTDLAFRLYLDYERIRRKASYNSISSSLLSSLRKAEVYLRVGLARKWEKYPDRCFLQVTGVYSFPDYLNGRCFADFVIQ